MSLELIIKINQIELNEFSGDIILFCGEIQLFDWFDYVSHRIKLI